MDKKYSIQDLVDIERLRELFENFSIATGFTTGFVAYPSQELLITTGWRDICTKFHRACPASAQCCKESNVYLTACLKDLKELNIKPCDNGLVDGATPVIVRGVHLASLSTGQVLLAPPDIAFFKSHAVKYGYDTDEYLAALAKVPVVTEEALKSALTFLSSLAVQIAEEGLQRLQIQEATGALRKAKAEVDRKVEQRTLELHIVNEQLQSELSERERAQEKLSYQADLLDKVSDAIISTDDALRIQTWNKAAERIYGWKAEEALEKNVDEIFCTEFIGPSKKEVAEILAAKGCVETEVIHKDRQGHKLFVRGNVAVLKNAQGEATGTVGVLRDVTKRKVAEEQLSAIRKELEQRVTERTAELNRANRTLRMLNACDEALLRAKIETDLLHEICRVIVEIGKAKMAWIGFAENDAEKTIRPVASAGTDKGYLKQAQVSWADVPRGRGPMGMAIRTHQTHQCLNIADAPCFAPWREAALQRGYRALISIPLLWEDQCFGALSIYSARAEGFSKAEVNLLQRLTNNITFGLVALRTRAGHEYLQKELLQISEREKQLIAQELHDGLCQNMAGTALMSRMLHIRLEARNDPDAKSAKEIYELLNTSVHEARNLSHGLHPVGPQGEGLMNALTQLAGTVRNLFHIDCTFECPRRVIIENETISTHLFRITQEAINNARKHGEADRVTISLQRSPKVITLTIEDNGVGIPAKMPKKAGMGLRIMNHRATEIGVAISVCRAGKKGGTVVTCTLPASR